MITRIDMTSGLMDFQSDDYRFILKEELAKRSRNNPRYSLRAFARDLEISAPRLSDILKGRYGLSAAAADKISKNLNFGAREKKYFVTLVRSQTSRSRYQRDMALRQLEKLRDVGSYRSLKLDAFRAISDWYHLALLELTYLRNFKSDLNWISNKLGLSTGKARSAINRLRRIGLLQLEGKNLKPVEDFTSAESLINPSKAIQSFHKQILQKTEEAIDYSPIDDREISSVVFAFDKKKIPLAKKRIKEFRRQFCKEMSRESDGTADSVYCVSLNFFEMSKNEKEEVDDEIH